MRHFALAAFLVFALAGASVAQFVEISGAYVPESNYYKKNGDRVEGASTRLQDFSFSASMPFMFDIDTATHKMSIWMASINYRNVNLHFEHVPEDYPDQNITAMIMVMNMRAFSKKWFLMGGVGGGVQSEYGHTNEQAVVAMGTVNVYRKYKYVDLGVGVVATNMLNTFLIMPLPVFNLHVGERLSFTMGQFGGYQLKYKFNKYFSLAAVSKGTGTTSIVERRDDDGEKKVKTFNFHQEVFGLEPTVRLGNSMFYVSMLGGVAYRRTFRLYNKSVIVMLRESFLRDAAESDVEPYISARFSFRPMPEK